MSIDADLSRTGVRAATLTRDLIAAHGEPRTVLAPWTGRPLHELRHATVQDVDAAEEQARAAQRAWRETTHRHRRRILLRAHDLLLDRRHELTDLVQIETGKARGPAFEEVFAAAQVLRYTAVTAEATLASHHRRSSMPTVLRARVDYAPKGLISVITPWNYPVALAAFDVIPALAAGNAVLHKADDQGVLSTLALRRTLVDAGLPPELWQVVVGPGDPVGNAVVDAGDHVAFTGSTATGTRIAERVASRLVGVSLELGGKNPLIVLDDVDPARAAAQAFSACFASAGQLCVSAERIYVVRPVAEAFLREFVAVVRRARIGGGLDYDAEIGSLTNAAQLARLRAHIEDAVGKGAELLVGGSPRPELGPTFHEPTVLSGVTPDMACFAEETFGPLVAVHVVESIDDAIALANDTEVGLNAIVLGSTRRALRVAGELEAGGVNLNEGYRALFGGVSAPMGGWKRSGLGRRNGPEGILRFTESRTVAYPTGIVPLPNSATAAKGFEPILTAALRVLRAVRLP